MNKEDKQKLKDTRNQERWDTKVKKWQLKYGDPYIDKWVDKHPLSMAKLMYSLYLESESNIHAKRVLAYVSFGIAILLIVASFWSPLFIVPSSIFLFIGNDILTNIRIDRIEQRRWNDTITAIVKAEEKEENEKRK